MTSVTSTPELSVIIVSYNTRELTLKAIETLYEHASGIAMEVVVWDNASSDGSSEAIAEAFPQVDLVASSDNLGFAAANNRAIERTSGEWVLLLNPDTETQEGSIQNLLSFAKANPKAGIVGGRTVFPDGSLNIASCWNKMTVWSLFCNATGLAKVFSGSTFFNAEAIGDWKRDSVRKVDIVVGCFLLTSRSLWDELGGFREKYFMFGEETDLCMRAAKLGYSLMITPDAQIVHHVGASYGGSEERIIKVLKGRITLIRDHWSPLAQPIGIGLIKLRVTVQLLRQKLGSQGDELAKWRQVWARRNEWVEGYQ